MNKKMNKRINDSLCQDERREVEKEGFRDLKVDMKEDPGTETVESETANRKSEKHLQSVQNSS